MACLARIWVRRSVEHAGGRSIDGYPRVGGAVGEGAVRFDEGAHCYRTPRTAKVQLHRDLHLPGAESPSQREFAVTNPVASLRGSSGIDDDRSIQREQGRSEGTTIVQVPRSKMRTPPTRVRKTRLVSSSRCLHARWRARQ